MTEINCWEFNNCDMEKTCKCPAYPEFGRICHMLAGTMCRKETQGTHLFKIISKIKKCRECEFYQIIANEDNNDI